MMNVFIVVDLKVVKSYQIYCDLFRVDFDLIWSCVSQVWCCYDNAKPEMFASLDSHWGLSWGVHVTVPKGKHGKTNEKLTICISCWQFERSLQESPDPDPIDPDHPWPSVTIPNHPFTNHLWHIQDAVVKQGLCIMSRASLKFPFCSAFVPWLHGHCLITEFWKAVILICNTFLQYAWFCNWDASNGFFETLARLIAISYWWLDMWRVSNSSLPWWSLQFGRQANQTNNVELNEASGNAQRWEKSGSKSRVFSVLLLYLYVITAVTDCHLSLAKARGSRFFFYKTLELTKTDPNPSGFQIPGKDFRDNFPSQLRVSFSFLCDRCTQRPLDVGGEPGSEAKFIVTSLCISNFWKISWRIR